VVLRPRLLALIIALAIVALVTVSLVLGASFTDLPGTVIIGGLVLAAWLAFGRRFRRPREPHEP
jgi:hypothetical protein